MLKIRGLLFLIGLIVAATAWAKSSISFYLVHPQNDQLIKNKTLDVNGFMKMTNADGKSIYWVGKEPLQQVTYVKKVSVQDAKPPPEGLMKKMESTVGNKDVVITLGGADSKKFYKITGDHVSQRIAIVMNDHVLAAPMVMQKITSGMLMLSNMTTEDAKVISQMTR